jgi:Domain of unknown function (DUF5658)
VIELDGTALAQQCPMMIRATATVLGLLLTLGAVPVAAAEKAESSAAPAAAASSDVSKPRPQIVPSLYASLAALQALDGYTTLRAIKAGAREANPLVANAAGQPIAMWSIKAASTAATIYYAERLWRGHRRGQAITLLAVTNAIMGVVAAHNASVLSSLR